LARSVGINLNFLTESVTAGFKIKQRALNLGLCPFLKTNYWIMCMGSFKKSFPEFSANGVNMPLDFLSIEINSLSEVVSLDRLFIKLTRIFKKKHKIIKGLFICFRDIDCGHFYYCS